MKKPPRYVIETCGSDKDCIVDGCVGGEEEAKASKRSAFDNLDKKCGKQVFFEDFSNPVDGEWKEIYDQDDFTFLHLKGKQHASKFYSVLPGTEFVVVEFLLYEIGAWDRGNKVSPLCVSVNVV